MWLQVVEQTICTESRGGKVSLREGRPALIVSSTSWTPDEDFSLLLEAATIYDNQVSHSASSSLVGVGQQSFDV